MVLGLVPGTALGSDNGLFVGNELGISFGENEGFIGTWQMAWNASGNEVGLLLGSTLGIDVCPEVGSSMGNDDGLLMVLRLAI